MNQISLWVYLSTQIAVRLAEHQLSCQAAFTALQVVAALWVYPAFLLTEAELPTCGWIVPPRPLFFCSCILSCSSLLARSTVSSFTGPARRNLAIVLSLLGLLLAISWIAGVQDLKSHWEKNSGQGWQDGSCQLDRVPVSMPLKYALVSSRSSPSIELMFFWLGSATSLLTFHRLHYSPSFCWVCQYTQTPLLLRPSVSENQLFISQFYFAQVWLSSSFPLYTSTLNSLHFSSLLFSQRTPWSLQDFTSTMTLLSIKVLVN